MPQTSAFTELLRRPKLQTHTYRNKGQEHSLSLRSDIEVILLGQAEKFTFEYWLYSLVLFLDIFLGL